ncbi:Pls/PosA family non-ribosomal peptide synthetase [Salinibacterium sp. ZJ454]|uniref:Pls/PosA family non-ribosomal peptide synthetase n=1 Tax=Salinibacterium sp. ZJ454 TaxID=2708339 RepID=UPI001AB034D7|nr:Pls/PosA family non-ribosomal peptide synthetase [Salinibacterium sp. ZJ454]
MTVTTTKALLLSSDRTPPERTLIDVLRATARSHPQASALADTMGSLSYRELLREVNASAARLSLAGVRRGDRVGIRIPSGTRTLYISILAVMAAGGSYVPVDADDPEERADLVFREGGVVGVIGADGLLTVYGDRDPAELDDREPPASGISNLGSPTGSMPMVGTVEPDDDAWVIFTSGSTGVPKGVSVSHRSAAAFVDAEARMFLQDDPIGPGDRVLAGLSVAFDASCEEMWLAWRHGACLVPAPRSLVRSGVDLGPWLIAHSITIVSTVPTLAALWPPESLELVRLLIFGGEACPPELAARLAVEGREVWNTYGPTEATVVACGAKLTGESPVRIGLPLDGWDLAVVDAEGNPVGEGEVGELIIGGVGLARYLDPAKDAEKYAPMPTLGWSRAYRSGDLVRFESEGLIFQGRADDQIKLGGRRIELGEIDAALSQLPGVAGGATVVQTTPAGNKILVGYIAPIDPTVPFDTDAAMTRLREELPASNVPLLALVDSLPTRTSGKVDRAALPWPLPNVTVDAAALSPTAGWIAEHWTNILGMPVTSPDDDFFGHGGGSLTAAQLISAIRARVPEARVTDIYDHPRIGALAAELDSRVPSDAREPRTVTPTGRGTQLAQTLLGIPLHVLVGLRWTIYLLTANNVLALVSPMPWVPTVSWWWLIAGFLLFVTPFGRMGIAVVAARLLLRGVTEGTYPRGGSVHLRLWLAEQVAQLAGAANLAGAPWISYYARALGAKIGPDVALHSLPPITGMLKIGAGASIEPEVDLSGYWIDGDLLRLGAIGIGAEATVGARSILLPGTRVGKGSEIAAGSAVHARVPAGQLWAGSPAERTGKAKHDWPQQRPPRGSRWVPVFGLSSIVLAALPAIGVVLGALIIGAGIQGSATLGEAALRALAWLPVAVAVAGVAYALLVVIVVRLLGIGLRPGQYPVRSRVGWQVWGTERLLDAARTLLFPFYASLFTPTWLRLLGAKVGRNVEVSTVLLVPRLTTIADDAFLADDTMVGSYELGHGWLRIGAVKIGRRAFLGNSGMTAPGRSVPKNGLVAVLSATPRKAKSGSSWLGNPPVRLRRAVTEFDESRTFEPPRRLKVARLLWELCRFVPVVVTTAIGLGVLVVLEWMLAEWGAWWTIALSGAVMLAAGAVAAGITTAAKWLLVGRIAAREHPLWSSFIWRNEVSDTFVEMVAAPWFAVPATGTPALAWWLRSLGAKIGRGVWCESYWLPEADLVRLGDGATVNRGCVVQTHLFHDRVMQLDTVEIDTGGTLGPQSVILPAAAIGAGATVGPASLVMRGEFVPDSTRWAGNPIAPWADPESRA